MKEKYIIDDGRLPTESGKIEREERVKREMAEERKWEIKIGRKRKEESDRGRGSGWKWRVAERD